MKYIILRNFNFGDPSNPTRMRAGNTFESDTLDGATPERLAKWVGLKWIAEDFGPLG